jgi:hypothetical protein
MPLAAPLILPFAELAGITIAGLGMAAASKKVSDFISDNPEISTQILTTLVPGGVGLNALFKKKAKEDSDDESVEVAPEDKTREERAKEMKKRFKEGKGDKREIGKKGFEEVIKPVKDIEDLLEGEERYDGSLEDAPKPKFDYTKFFKADGGRIGYVGGGLATTQDFANALKSVSAGTTYQQQTQAKEYARNEAANELRAAIQGGGIDSFLGGAGLSNYRSMFPNDRAGTNRQGDFTGTYNARKEQLLNDLMNKKLSYTSYAPPPPPTDSLTGMLESQMLPNMADGSMKSLAEQNAIRDRVLAAQKAQEESYYLTDPISGKKYTSQDEAINDLGLVTYNQRFADGGRIGFANGGIENIIGKNLDNVTNVAKGLDKEMLDMTFDDKYYRDKIQPAKLGQAPIPGRMEMMLKSKPFTAVGIGMRPGTFGERAQPTKAASQFLNTLGKGAKFVGTKVGPLSFMDIFASTPLGADDEVTDEMRQSIEMSPTSTTGIMVDANDDFRTSPATYYNSAPNFNADVLREEEDAQYNLPQKNMLQNLKDYLPFIGDKSITGMLTRGIGQFFNNIGDRIPSTPQYQQYTPGYNYGNLNPNLIDDFYDPATGLNRFDRAKTLFGQSRTLSEFLSKRRERAAAEADLVQRREIERKLEREKALARNTSSNIDYGGFVSGGGTHSSDSSFTGHSSATGGGMGQSGWGGPRADGGFIGQYSNGGLATMFRRKQ